MHRNTAWLSRLKYSSPRWIALIDRPLGISTSDNNNDNNNTSNIDNNKNNHKNYNNSNNNDNSSGQ